ncbi:hypothetical protein [Acanthamoeba castellanii mimivirus]|jgi:DNA repair exonuclease SbcCD ATPase subunit|uniref:Uncharacterized protein n=3 Tax=Mimivirus TaxID=315393 RepID=A0A0G2Y1I6_MIMIV|nr:hypothetical protein MIMI_gp0801 [Acanthamoeba polyphaga mimivirus]AHA45090.1 hypothetical protein HIRU_S184 [Hirudovirus strain Sangsue]AMK62025.1 hypothetical protein [Samba virus]BAV61876.1 hypothetical protein [Acanthamoeba castellanii mimivirus]ADO18824.1 hypothetical protein [Acanthamoeba polyphaga mimivirus]AKI79530.1 hypothetical protein [Acanthamoeba polyphaga mimivirus]
MSVEKLIEDLRTEIKNLDDTKNRLTTLKNTLQQHSINPLVKESDKNIVHDKLNEIKILFEQCQSKQESLNNSIGELTEYIE